MNHDASSSEVGGPGSTDEGLIVGIAAGDESAWTRFVDEYSPLIYVWCRRCDLQAADARDVSQQVLQAVSRSIDSFSNRDGQGTFRGWLFTVTRNLVRNHLAKMLRGPRARGGSSIQIRLMEEPEAIDEDSLSIADQPSPIQGVLDEVRSAFDQRTWRCFWLVVVEGHSAVEVAERLGMNPAAVRQAKYRVTKRLRQALEKNE